MNPEEASWFAHATAVIDEGCTIGAGSKVWHFSHIMPGAVLGEGCNIGQNVVISPDQMRHGIGFERERFVQHCKDEYHAEPFQRSLQARDAETSSKKVNKGKHSRWSRELQRRLGTKALWEVGSFTGILPAEFLAQINNVGAPQPDVHEPDSRDRSRSPDDPQIGQDDIDLIRKS